MIDVAARATNGMKIPGRKSMRADIKRTFKEHLTKLKARLNVGISLRQSVPYSYIVQGPTVTGEVNLTCDPWQAIQMAILQLLAIGLRKQCPHSGNSRVAYLALRNSAMLTTVCD